MTGMIDATLTDPVVTPDPTSLVTYVKSEYAGAYGADISKTYQNISNGSVRAGDTIQVDIAIKNTGNSTLQDGEYLDTIPKIFDTADTTKYTISLGGMSEDRSFQKPDDSYDAIFTLKDIPIGSTLHILYQVKALPVAYGEMMVGLLE